MIQKKSPLRTHSISPIALSALSTSPPQQQQQQQLPLAPPAAMPAISATSPPTTASLKITPLALTHHLQNGGAATKSINVQPIAINFTTSADGVLTATSSTANGGGAVTSNASNGGGGGLQIISTNGNGVHHHHHLSQQPQSQQPQQQHLQHNVITTTGALSGGTSITAKLLKGGHVRELCSSGGQEPPKKMLKLINGTTVNGGSVTLSQVVVSPIQVNGSGGNLATIELSSGNASAVQRASTVTASNGAVTSVSGAQLQKLLVHGNGHSVGTNSEMARLPGGAELNILTNGAGNATGAPSTGNTNGGATSATSAATTTTTASLYRQHNGKLAIVNSGFTFKSKFLKYLS